VAVGERVDRLKLGVRDGSLGQCRNVVAAHEGDQVILRGQKPARVRRDELSGVRWAGAIRRAPAVRFSIWELDADSLRSSRAANGVVS
jgi:hypothetical protein